MNTFDEEFKNFIQNFTLEKLYLKNTYSSQSQKRDKCLFIPLIFMIAGILMPLFDTFKIFGITLASLSCLAMFLYIYRERVVKARNELKGNGLPVSKNFYEWKTEELKNSRIKYLYQEYENIDSNIIQKRIEISEEQVKILDKDIFSDFEKVTEFFGKNYILLIIGVFVGLFNKSEYSESNFNILLRFIAFILGFSYFITLSWKCFIKKNLMASYNFKKEQYLDYIFVMKNILMMRI
ncbi:hypothetical protein [Chryseobacterium oryctis]|uniref:SMODS and SLOG-associating 2TM effector domain-containing protein n=1 Tax=Chryseobacterium oryctis TaxID=2952618 RepID=A0ABT3HS89_9FLAO|nr:hypothetical protein [Chryseobacterium oryctis]MCW3162642.1 hypothetical protein [Chryseobacterium oryctis]